MTSLPPEVAPLADSFAGLSDIERELGCGGMGVVYLAHDVKLDRRSPATLGRSNIFGNGVDFPAQGGNSGIRNQSGGTVNATKTYRCTSTGLAVVQDTFPESSVRSHHSFGSGEKCALTIFQPSARLA